MNISIFPHFMPAEIQINVSSVYFMALSFSSITINLTNYCTDDYAKQSLLKNAWGFYYLFTTEMRAEEYIVC